MGFIISINNHFQTGGDNKSADLLAIPHRYVWHAQELASSTFDTVSNLDDGLYCCYLESTAHNSGPFHLSTAYTASQHALENRVNALAPRSQAALLICPPTHTIYSDNPSPILFGTQSLDHKGSYGLRPRILQLRRPDYNTSTKKP
jgi:hypothetical protein